MTQIHLFTKVSLLAATLFAGSANAAVTINYLDTWTGTGSTRTQTVDIDGISTLVTLTGSSTIGSDDLSFNSDAGFGGWGVASGGVGGIHGTTAGGALESFTISLSPVSGSATYTFESVSIVGIGANANNSTTTMNVGSATLDVGRGTTGPGGSGSAIRTTSSPQVTSTLLIDFASTDDPDEAGAFWRSATISAVPEPSSAALIGLAGLALFLRRRR